MTLNELRYIVAVADHKHFRKAAQSCNISQPTLSVAIRKFEEEHNIILFERRKNEIIITPTGERIIEVAREILAKAHEIEQIAKADQDSLNSELRVGAIYTIGPYLLPKFIHKLHKNYPSLPLLVEENYTAELAKKLNAGQLDMIILALPFNDPSIETLPLYQEHFVAALAKDHPLAQQEKIRIEDLQRETVLILGSGHCFRDQVLEAYPFLAENSHHSMQRTLEGSSLETMLYMVASGVGMTILPCTAAQQTMEDIVIRPLESPVPARTVALAYRRSFPRQKVLKAVVNTLKGIELPCTEASR
ncbi:MAG TPA: hydrogen peroxide-inducible genes activator [Piscirickettsiaceae bacterium]|nr:hydrogen peroxide-inducible genes activator [Piscirickettsiaceae bacterium]HIQ39754.1 hydrogen peroxide-inducible genes activator [Sulfurivirga caldicuralii]